MLRMRNT